MLTLQHMNMLPYMYSTLTTFFNKLMHYRHMTVMGTGQSTDACAGVVHVTHVYHTGGALRVLQRHIGDQIDSSGTC